jgi:DNA-binding NarL/FixJ family response regulator
MKAARFCRQRSKGEAVTSVRVLLADDHEGFLRTLREELEPDFEIVGASANGEQAIRAVQMLDPDVLVIDISMPILDGLQTAACLRSEKSRTKIVFLTIHEQSGYISAAFAAGGSGYVTKRHLRTDLVQAIREVLQGRTYISPSLHV